MMPDPSQPFGSSRLGKRDDIIEVVVLLLCALGAGALIGGMAGAAWVWLIVVAS